MLDKKAEAFMSVRVPREMDDAVEAEAERWTVSKSVIVRWAINDYLSRQPQTPGPQETTQHVEA